MPVVKQTIQRVFKVEPSTTLNADEAVARGCALQVADVYYFYILIFSSKSVESAVGI